MSKEDRNKSLVFDLKRAEKKLTVEGFLASAAEMDERSWEATWAEAVNHAEDVASSESIVIYPGHYAVEGAPPAEESAMCSLMEILLSDALKERRGMKSRAWEIAVAVVARAWSGRFVGECVERFKAALDLFNRSGEVAIDLTQGPGEESCVLFVRSDSLELAQESAESVAKWFVRYLKEKRVPFEYLRLEIEDGKTGRCEFNSRLTCRVRAMLA